MTREEHAIIEEMGNKYVENFSNEMKALCFGIMDAQPKDAGKKDWNEKAFDLMFRTTLFAVVSTYVGLSEDAPGAEEMFIKGVQKTFQDVRDKFSKVEIVQ